MYGVGNRLEMLTFVSLLSTWNASRGGENELNSHDSLNVAVWAAEPLQQSLPSA